MLSRGPRVSISSLRYARAGPDREGMLYMTIHDVLFATDFSDASRLAGETAAEFARHFGARLHVLHVVPPVTDPTPAPGRVARQVVDYARRNAIDLIVLGTHGRTGVSHALLGSVAEAVTRRARCRVLTVPATLPGTSTAPALIEEAEKPTSCRVCGAEAQDELICETCRARIRGEALDHKLREERAGRRA